MFRVVVAEDDRIIRKAIVQAGWDGIKAEVVAEAADGQAALEVIRQTDPHLLITDINMPFMTGIQLAKQLRKEGFNTRIIFLTGYDDFEYLHEAILLKSDDYLLKPVKMQGLLVKATAALDAWQTDNKKTEQLEKTKPLLQEKFISNLLYSPAALEEVDIELELATIGIQLQAPDHIVFNVFAPNYQGNKLITEYLTPFFEKDNTELISYQKNEAFVVFPIHEQDKESIVALRENIRQHMSDCIQETVFITMSAVFDELLNIKTAILEAKINMEIQKIAELAEKDQQFNALFGVGKEENRYFVELNPMQTSHDKITSFFDFLTEGNLNLLEAKKIAFNFVVFLIIQVNQICNDGGSPLDIYQLSKDMLAVESLTQLIELLEPMVARWEAAFERQQKENRSDSLVDRAVIYMKQHFSNPELSLVKLSEEIHVTSPYLSNLFKEQTGRNFTDYLLELRMEKSKELLKNTLMKTYEIAEEVGYTNPHYFSSSFKKYTGDTPMTYRKTADSKEAPTTP